MLLMEGFLSNLACTKAESASIARVTMPNQRPVVPAKTGGIIFVKISLYPIAGGHSLLSAARKDQAGQ